MDEPIKQYPWIVSIALALLISVIAMDATGTIAIYPFLQKDLDVNLLLGPRICSIFFMGFSLSLALHKILIHLLNYKSLMVIGVLLYGACSILFVHNEAIYFILALRFLQGIALGLLCQFSTLCVYRLSVQSTYFFKACLLAGFTLAPGLVFLVHSTVSWHYTYFLFSIFLLSGFASLAHLPKQKNVQWPSIQDLSLQLLSFVLFMVSILMMVVLIDFSFTRYSSISKTLLLVFLFSLSVAGFLYNENKLNHKALLLSPMVRNFHPKILYFVALIVGFFLLSLMLIEASYLKTVVQVSLLNICLLLVSSTLLFSLSFYAAKVICLQAKPIYSMVAGLVFLILSFTLQIQFYPPLSSFYLVLMLFFYSCGWGLSTGAATTYSKRAPPNHQIHIPILFILLFSVASQLGYNFFGRVVIKNTIISASAKIDKAKILLPQSKPDHIDLIPYVLNRMYAQKHQQKNLDIQQLVPLFVIYKNAFTAITQKNAQYLILFVFFILVMVIYNRDQWHE